jgi:hypothetical protein
MLVEENSFANLVQAVRAGKSEAVDKLIEQYESAIRREIRFTLLDAHLQRTVDESDICQSVMMRFLVKLWTGDFDLQSSEDLVNLLKSMVRNRVADVRKYWTAQRRDVRRNVAQMDPDAAPVSDATPGCLVANAELLNEFERRLSEQDRKILTMRREGNSWKEIAATIDSPDRVEAVRKRYQRTITCVSRDLGVEE